MKALIEIDLEIDGEWRPEDKDRLIEMILANPHHGGWTVDEDRLVVFNGSVTVEITE